MSMLLTPAVVVEAMKRQATRLKKTLQMPHHVALEKVARDHGYHHWHHVCECEKATAPAEQTLRLGWVFALDQVSADRYALAAQHRPLPWLAELVAWDYRREPDPYEGAADEMAAFQRLVYFAGNGEPPADVAAAGARLAPWNVEPLALWIAGRRLIGPAY